MANNFHCYALLLLCCMVELCSLSTWCLNGGLLSTSSWCNCKVVTFSDFVNKQPMLMSNIYSYQVVIDAGSTGTRVHIFTFHRTFTGLVLAEADFHEVEPGISTYHSKPEKAAKSVRNLLQAALVVVPEGEWNSTPVSFRATAGLRLLPSIVANNIIDQVRQMLMSSPFKTLEMDLISIMDGDDEGIFAWTTLNFLTGNLNRQIQNAIGALDLGGGSTQIVFKPTLKETLSTSPETHIITVTILGIQHELYSYSYLGLGLMAARQAVFEFTKIHKNAILGNQGIFTTESPCISPAYRGTWTFNNKKIAIHGNSSFSYENCLHYVKQIVKKVDKPVEIVRRDFYAFSYYFDTAVKLGLVAANVGGPVSLESYLNSARKVCSTERAVQLITNNTPFLCLDAVYVTTLLRNGFGFLDDQVFQIVKKVNNVEVSWALGAALHMYEGDVGELN